MKSLEETRISSESIFDGVLVKVTKDIVRLPNGRTAVREYLSHLGAAAILAFLPNGNIVLERQYRYPLRRVFIEIPAGKLDPGETPLVSVKRELLEETGYIVEEPEYLLTFNPCIGYSDEVITIYSGRVIGRADVALDTDEFIEVFDCPFAEALRMVTSGEIMDSKTIIAILAWQEKITRGG